MLQLRLVYFTSKTDASTTDLCGILIRHTLAPLGVQYLLIGRIWESPRTASANPSSPRVLYYSEEEGEHTLTM